MGKSLLFSVVWLLFTGPILAFEKPELLEFYSKLQKALANDQIKDAQTLAVKTHSDLEAFLKTLLKPDEIYKKMEAGVKALTMSKTDSETRSAFGVFSEGVTTLVRENKNLQENWQLFYCPMVPKGNYGYWVQPKGESLRNPYFGAKMLTCGVRRPW